MNGNYPKQKIDWKKYDWSTKEIKLYLSEKKQLDSWVILALGYLGH